MTRRTTPTPKAQAVSPEPDPEQPRHSNAERPASGDPAGNQVDKTLARFRTTPPATAAAVAPTTPAPWTKEPFPPVEPPPEDRSSEEDSAPPAEPEGPDAATNHHREDPSAEPLSEASSAPPPGSSSQFRKKETDEPIDEAAALAEALAPLIGMGGTSDAQPQEPLHTYLEPMLRQTVRRAIAEQLESARMFANASLLDRVLWRLEALVSSRTYEEIVFERTHRYQVEELYLFSHDLRRLLSYASHDPAQHGSPRKVRPTVRVLRARLGDLQGKDEHAFDLPLGRLGLVREGKFTLLVAVLRGRSNSLIRTDLDYLQFQIEERYGEQLRNPENVFMHTLQPMLEAGLLIQAPPVEHSPSA